MRNRISFPLIMVLVAFLFQPQPVKAQDKQVHGIVVDSSNDQAMAFVNIAVVGSTYGTVSNQNGEFQINLDKIVQSDSIAFHYVGYKTVYIESTGLSEGIIIEMSEDKFKIEEVTILANPVTAEELINNALYRTGVNYPQITQRMEVFKRRNSANYIDLFDISLIKSDIKDIDTSFIETMVDSMPRYMRNYSDNLYAFYNFPDDTAKKKKKIKGIKRVILNEEDGGDMAQLEKVMMNTMNKQEGDKTFWKLKTGIVSLKVNQSNSDQQAAVTITVDDKKKDSLQMLNPRGLYALMRSDQANWTWDFIRKPDQYKYKITSIVTIGDEFAYAIRFDGRLRGDCQGMIYIALDTYAILRIEYSIKNRRLVSAYKILGVSYSEIEDSGLLIYTKDEHGYYLKYAMDNKVTEYGVNRAFSMIKKKKRPIIRKKLNEVELDINMTSRDETCNETLVVSREMIDQEAYLKIIDKGVKPEYISTYSDTIWKGYSIIEPTKEMKEYQVKIK